MKTDIEQGKACATGDPVKFNLCGSDSSHSVVIGPVVGPSGTGMGACFRPISGNATEEYAALNVSDAEVASIRASGAGS